MNLSNESVAAIRDTIIGVMNNIPKDENFEVITDFHLHLNPDTGLLVISDDEVQLGSVVVEDWIDIDGDEFTTIVASELTQLLNQMDAEHQFDYIGIAKPFTFILEDNECETIEELFIVDDDNIYFPTDILIGMDDDLDDFFEQLMKE